MILQLRSAHNSAVKQQKLQKASVASYNSRVPQVAILQLDTRKAKISHMIDRLRAIKTSFSEFAAAFQGAFQMALQFGQDQSDTRKAKIQLVIDQLRANKTPLCNFAAAFHEAFQDSLDILHDEATIGKTLFNQGFVNYGFTDQKKADTIYIEWNQRQIGNLRAKLPEIRQKMPPGIVLEVRPSSTTLAVPK